MYKDKTILGVIAARGGSKGLPGKNIRDLNGKPLIVWTIEHAKHSKLLDKFIVSSDSEEILDVSRKNGAEVPFVRPDALASDSATSIDLLLHALEFFENKDQYYDYIALLEPTSPLREANDIDDMIKKIVDNDGKSIVGVGEVLVPPSAIKKLNGIYLEKYDSSLDIVYRRQDQEMLYAVYGGVYIVNCNILKKEKSIYYDKMLYHKVKRHQCYEIDDINDFYAVENIMKHRMIQNEL